MAPTGRAEMWKLHLIVINILIVYVYEAHTAVCFSPLGMSTGEIHDWQISASSILPPTEDKNCHIKYARIYQPNGRAWCAGRKAIGEWLLVDLGVSSKITGVVIQGKGDGESWVTKFHVSYSGNAYHWHFVKDSYNDKKEFHGNTNSHQLRKNFINPSIMARFIRIHVIAWHGHPSLRAEILGCQECLTHISEEMQVKLSASRSSKWKKKRSCQPQDIQLNSHKGWCTRKRNGKEWLEFDFGPPHKITGIITKGLGDRRRKQWVRSYIVNYSNDSKVWFTYKDGNHADIKVFGGNLDKHTERRHYLNSPIVARYIRIIPKSWHKAISMRVAIIGCQHTGECENPFFRITPDSACVENLAFERKTWVNDKRHRLEEWTTGNASLAVDGRLDTNMSQCSVIENYKTAQPIWMVDLGRMKEVAGVRIVSWQGEGGGDRTIYRDYVFGLDKLSVFVEDKPRIEHLTQYTHNLCDTITRLNNALFTSELHLECKMPVRGRYVYIKGTGVPNRWRKTFSLVLCEVMVY